MSRVRIKICGITSVEDLLVAVDAGADAVGFIVDIPRSPRNLSLSEAKKLIKVTPILVETVVVTIPKNLSRLKKLYRELNPSILQVHGMIDSHNDIRKQLTDVQVIRAVQVKKDLTEDMAVKAADMFDAILLDSHLPGKQGGTGKTHDWNLSRRIRDAIYPKPLILAGGLRPENVKEAIRVVRPYAVDVSSGVELHPGVKDRRKVFKFVKNVREVWM